MSKVCKKCGHELPITEFYVHPRMADGHLSFCKECVKERVRAYGKRPYVMQRDRERRRGGKDPLHIMRVAIYQQTHKEQCRRSKRKYAVGNPVRRSARRQLNQAIAKGLLRREPCAVCGTTENIHAHHPNYAKPLEVVWFCPIHHGEAHWK